MKTMNKVFLIGYLGNDPELRKSQGGVPFTSLSVATNRLRGKEGDPKVIDVEWHKVYVWGNQGERCAQWLNKGALVFIEGEVRHLESSTEEGEKRKRTVIHAHEVKFLNPKMGTLDNRHGSINHDAVAHR